MELMNPSVVRCKVCHIRKVPVENSFTYDIDYLLLDELALKNIHKTRLFSFGKPNLISLYPSDHSLVREGGVDEIFQLAREMGVTGCERILLLTHPRYWGYTFNPVSFWLLFNSHGGLRAVFAEVHNTFGDRHTYLCTGPNGANIESETCTSSRKNFHVSPFFDIEGNYRFHFLVTKYRIAIKIFYKDNNSGGLATSIAGDRKTFSDAELVKALFRHPFGSIRMNGLIHWQAIKLWRKGVRYRSRPDPPSKNITR